MPPLAYFLTAVASVTPPVVDPAQAAGNALMACVKHAAGMARVDAAHADALVSAGLIYHAVPPAKLASMIDTPYGKGSVAQAPSTEGDVYAVGYDKGACIVMALGTSTEPVEQRLTTLFSIPNSWRPEPIPQRDAASRWTQYGWTVNGRRLTAQMKVQPLPTSPIKGLVMVTIAPDLEKK